MFKTHCCSNRALVSPSVARFLVTWSAVHGRKWPMPISRSTKGCSWKANFFQLLDLICSLLGQKNIFFTPVKMRKMTLKLTPIYFISLIICNEERLHDRIFLSNALVLSLSIYYWRCVPCITTHLSKIVQYSNLLWVMGSNVLTLYTGRQKFWDHSFLSLSIS